MPPEPLEPNTETSSAHLAAVTHVLWGCLKVKNIPAEVYGDDSGGFMDRVVVILNVDDALHLATLIHPGEGATKSV